MMNRPMQELKISEQNFHSMFVLKSQLWVCLIIIVEHTGNVRHRNMAITTAQKGQLQCLQLVTGSPNSLLVQAL